MSDGYVDLDANYVKEADEPSTIPENIGALELLQMAYRGQIELSPQQARCAIESLPYETPKHSATAIASIDGQTFAEALERATTRSEIVRSGSVALLNGPVPELPPTVANKPFSTFRRF
jgi:hypothetical protein